MERGGWSLPAATNEGISWNQSVPKEGNGDDTNCATRSRAEMVKVVKLVKVGESGEAAERGGRW